MCKLVINHISMSSFVYIKCKRRTCELLDPVSFPSNVTPVCHISTATNIQHTHLAENGLAGVHESLPQPRELDL